VMDRGMVSEENIEFLRERGAQYIVGTRKTQLRHFQQQLAEEENWSQVAPGVEVKMVAHPDGRGLEQFVLCRSQARQEKESAMLRTQYARLLGRLEQMDAALRQRPKRDVVSVAQRVGRWVGRYTMAEKMIEVVVVRDARGWAAGLQIQQRKERLQWASLAHGAYLLRTNCGQSDPAQFWRWYMQLQQAEAAFRTSKQDLGLRPVFHQKTHRVEAHILVCFLALALWRTLEMWMQSKALGTCARQLLKEIATIRSMDVVLPLKERAELRLRVVAKPDPLVGQLLQRLGILLPRNPKIVENVVEKNAA